MFNNHASKNKTTNFSSSINLYIKIQIYFREKTNSIQKKKKEQKRLKFKRTFSPSSSSFTAGQKIKKYYKKKAQKSSTQLNSIDRLYYHQNLKCINKTTNKENEIH